MTENDDPTNDEADLVLHRGLAIEKLWRGHSTKIHRRAQP